MGTLSSDALIKRREYFTMHLEKEIDLAPLCKVGIFSSGKSFYYLVSFSQFGYEGLAPTKNFDSFDEALRDAMLRIHEWRQKFRVPEPAPVKKAPVV